MLARLASLPLGALWGSALVLLGVGAVIVSSSFDADPSTSVVGGDAGVNAGAGDPSDPRSHNSPTVVRNPVKEDNLAVSSRIDTPRFSCALHVSFNGGMSWTPTPIPAPAGEEPKCFAPDVAFASDGTLYLSFATLGGRGNEPNAVWVSRSTDGGRSLSKPKKAIGPLAFQVRLAVDPANPRRVYLSWLQGSDIGLLRFSGPGNPIRSARSDDGGASWRKPARVSSAAHPRAVTPSPAVGPDGRLYVLYVDLGEDRLDYEGGHDAEGGPPYTGRYKLVLARSVDRGKTWEESVVDDKILPIQRFIVFYPPFPSIAVDQESGRVYAGFHDGRVGDPDVMVWSLAPGGSGWQGPTRVNDTPERDGRWQYLPKLSVAPSGRLDVAYYDRRKDPKNRANDVALQSSFDSGKHFEPSVRLTSQPFDSKIGFGSPHDLADLGSRLGLISGDAFALTVWTDTRAGTIASNKQDLFRGLVVFSQPSHLAQPVKDGLRYGGLALALAGLALLAAWRLGAPRPSDRPPA